MCNEILNLGLNISKEFPKHFKLAEKCFDLAGIIEQNIKNKEIKPSDENIFEIILLHNFYKTTDALISVVKLIDCGLLGDAQTITRKIIEIAINMKYITIDGKRKRALRYWYFMEIMKKRNFEYIIKNSKNKELIRKKYEKSLSETKKNIKLVTFPRSLVQS